MKIDEIIRTRRSIRNFKSSMPSDKEVISILQAGRWAPSGLNNQPWRFIIVKDETEKTGLAGFTKYGNVIKQAALSIVVCLDLKNSYNRDKDLMAIGACIENMLLQAHALGIGTCWLGEILNNKAEAAVFLGLEEILEITAVIALGYPAETPASMNRKELKSLIINH